MSSKGILEEKLKTYYADINTVSYKAKLFEGLKAYTGKKFSRILDIGAGVGSFEDATKHFGYKTSAIEGSDFGYDECKRKGYDCEKMFLKKGAKLPYKDNSFSLVMMNQVIEHITKEDGEYYIKEIIRILEPGGVALIKSPSRYTRIWMTDPHHVHCWKPNELKAEVEKSLSKLSRIDLQRVPLEFWMGFKYNVKIINYWHKYNRAPRIKRFFYLINKGIDKVLFTLTGSDRMLAVANVLFVKKT